MDLRSITLQTDDLDETYIMRTMKNTIGKAFREKRPDI